MRDSGETSCAKRGPTTQNTSPSQPNTSLYLVNTSSYTIRVITIAVIRKTTKRIKYSSGSRNFGGGGQRNKLPRAAAIFFITIFTWGRGHGPLAPPPHLLLQIGSVADVGGGGARGARLNPPYPGLQKIIIKGWLSITAAYMSLKALNGFLFL